MTRFETRPPRMSGISWLSSPSALASSCQSSDFSWLAAQASASNARLCPPRQIAPNRARDSSFFTVRADSQVGASASSFMTLTKNRQTQPSEVGSRLAVCLIYYRRVNIESNRIYYVRAELVKSRTGGLQSSPELTVVDSQEGATAISNLRRVTLSP